MKVPFVVLISARPRFRPRLLPFNGLSPAGIEDDDVDRIVGVLHLTLDRGYGHRRKVHIRFLFDLRIDRNQIVSRRSPGRMAGIEDETGGVAARRVSRLPKSEIAFFMSVLAGVLDIDDVEADRSQGLRHQLGVFLRIGQLRQVALIVGIADHQGDARFRHSGICDNQTEQER